MSIENSCQHLICTWVARSNGLIQGCNEDFIYRGLRMSLNQHCNSLKEVRTSWSMLENKRISSSRKSFGILTSSRRKELDMIWLTGTGLMLKHGRIKKQKMHKIGWRRKCARITILASTIIACLETVKTLHKLIGQMAMVVSVNAWHNATRSMIAPLLNGIRVEDMVHVF